MLWIGLRICRASIRVSLSSFLAQSSSASQQHRYNHHCCLHIAEDKKAVGIEFVWNLAAVWRSHTQVWCGVRWSLRWEAKCWWSSCLWEARQGELLHVLMFHLPPRLIPLHPFLECCNRDGGARKGHVLLLPAVLLPLFRFGAQVTRGGACLGGARQRLDHIFLGYWWTLDWFLKPFPKPTPNYFAFNEEQKCHPCTIKVLSVWMMKQLLWCEGGQGGIQGWIELFGKFSPEGLPRFDINVNVVC